MFVRVNTVRSEGGTYEYLRLVETYREGGQPRQRVLANLGRLDVLRAQGKIDALIRKLRRFSDEVVVTGRELEESQAPTWGPVLVARHLWNELSLSETIRACCSKGRKQFDVVETAFVLASARLAHPSSEHGLARWLDEAYVCDAKGRRWLPQWRPCEKVTAEDRVRVESRQLVIWYRTLDALVSQKKAIEAALYLRLRDLFSIKVDLVFYDLTSLYFEGHGPLGLAKRGYSRDGKPRNPQIVLGVVMANGFPIASHIFPGNTLDKQTVQEVVKDLEKRFGIRQILFVGDRGMVSKENIQCIADSGYRYLVGLQRRRNPEVWQVLLNLKGRWEDCGCGTKVQEVRLMDSELRYFVATSEERLQYERDIRLGNMTAAREALEKIKKAVAKGELRDAAKIGKRVGRAFSRTKGYRYFSWEVTKTGEFRFWEDAEKMAKEEGYEGKYILKTTDRNITAYHAVEAYKDLGDVEWAFREIKDIIEGRPIWHQKEERVQGHVFVGMLSLLLMRVLRKSLKEKDVYLSSQEAFTALKTIEVYQLEVEGEQHRIVPRPRGDALRVLKALGIRKLEPPMPPRNAPERVM